MQLDAEILFGTTVSSNGGALMVEHVDLWQSQYRATDVKHVISVESSIQYTATNVANVANPLPPPDVTSGSGVYSGFWPCRMY